MGRKIHGRKTGLRPRPQGGNPDGLKDLQDILHKQWGRKNPPSSDADSPQSDQRSPG